MSLVNLAQANLQVLKGNPYPGRGIIIGLSPDEQNYVQVYWIMGRSENSRNRIFVNEKWFVKTAAFDEKKVVDPSLIIYYPIKFYGGLHVVSNGDQTDTIIEYLRDGRSFEDAIHSRDFEPDPPNFTPRISGMLDLNQAPYHYKLSIIKTTDNDSTYTERHFYNYQQPIPGFGHCIHTYAGDGNPLPSFMGEPVIVPVSNSIEETARFYWGLLSPENRVSLLVKFVNASNGEVRFKMYNKNLGE